MITLDEKIAKTERLLRRLEADEPYLRARLSPLGAEHRQDATAFAGRVRAEAEAELRRLRLERGLPGEFSNEVSSEFSNDATVQERAG